MPIVNTSDGYFAVVGGSSQEPFASPQEAQRAELGLASMNHGMNGGQPAPNFPHVRLGPQGTRTPVTPAVLPAPSAAPMQTSIGDAYDVVEGEPAPQPGVSTTPGGLTITIGDAVMEHAKKAQGAARSARRVPHASLLPKKKGTRTA